MPERTIDASPDANMSSESYERPETTVTNTALLIGLAEQREEVWAIFDGRYRPILESFGRRVGLKAEDAEDAASEALKAFYEQYQTGRYDRDRGRLRHWLYGIARKKIIDVCRRRSERVMSDQTDATAFLNKIPDERMENLWETQWRWATVRHCLDEMRSQVKPTTLRAFELFVLEEWPADEVAARVGITRNAVYLARRNVLTLMRKRQKYWEENW